MQNPIRIRGDVPFYYHKSLEQFRIDPYERYDPMVIRQSMLHLADELWNIYPMQPINDYIVANCPDQSPKNILEIGCGVGRLIGNMAIEYPQSKCWGIDYSYQMLKRASEIWITAKEVALDVSKFGFQSTIHLQTRSLTNLKFGLAQSENLPFLDGSQDLVISSFLLDRLQDPMKGLDEMKRVLSPSGRIIIVTPLNFNSMKNWDQFFPIDKLREEIEGLGLKVLDWKEGFIIKEPMDARGNYIRWNCIATVVCREVTNF